jgi:uncharacterized protein
MRTFGVGLLAIGIALLSAGVVRAQSFSCRGNESCPETTICHTPALANLDATMAGMYFALRNQMSRPGASNLLGSQVRWLAERNSCGCDADCLFRTYQERIAAFRAVLGY